MSSLIFHIFMEIRAFVFEVLHLLPSPVIIIVLLPRGGLLTEMRPAVIPSVTYCYLGIYENHYGIW